MTFLVGARLFFALLFALVTYLTLTPNPDETERGFAMARWLAAFLLGNEGMGDKVAHFMAYAALGGSAALARIRLAGRAPFAVAGLALYGAALEGLQGIGGVRSPEAADALANFLGAGAGYPAAAALISLAGKARA